MRQSSCHLGASGPFAETKSAIPHQNASKHQKKGKILKLGARKIKFARALSLGLFTLFLLPSLSVSAPPLGCGALGPVRPWRGFALRRSPPVTGCAVGDVASPPFGVFSFPASAPGGFRGDPVVPLVGTPGRRLFATFWNGRKGKTLEHLIK